MKSWLIINLYFLQKAMTLKSIFPFLLIFLCSGFQAEIPVVNLGKADRYDIKLHEIKQFRIKKSGYEPNERYELRVSYLGSVIN